MKRVRKILLGVALLAGIVLCDVLSDGSTMSTVHAFTQANNVLQYNDKGNMYVFGYGWSPATFLAVGREGYTVESVVSKDYLYVSGYGAASYKAGVATNYGTHPVLQEQIELVPYKITNYGYELDTANTVTKKIVWESYPEDCLYHCNGHKFDLEGKIEGWDEYTLECTVYVMPSPNLNKQVAGTGTNLLISGSYYTDGTNTGYFHNSKSGTRFFLEDGSYIANAWQQINGSWYYFTAEGYMEFNAYVGGYFLGADGVRVDAVSYSWVKDGTKNVYMGSNGNCLKSCYALIDGELCYFDLNGHLWQTFGYPSYIGIHSDNVLAGYVGSFSKEKKEDIIAQVTKIRQEAVQLGLLKQEDYVVPKWSYIQERGAMIRAVEASIGGYEVAHDRLTENTVEVSFGGEDASEACLAWGGGSCEAAIQLYYIEKDAALNKTGGETGHYYALLYSAYIGTATIDGTNAYCIASETTGGEEQVAFDDYSVQIFETSKAALEKRGALVNGSSVRGTTIYTYNESEVKKALGIATWERDDEGNLYYIDENGEYVENAWKKIDGEFYYFDFEGKAQKYEKGMKVQADTSDDYYRIISLKTKGKKVTGGNVEFVRLGWKKTDKLSIPAKIKIAKKSFKVTSIAAQACQKNKYIKSVTIGSNVKTIGKKAFYKCKNLKTITIKTKKLKKNSIGKNAFKGIKKSPVVKVPKSKKKAYKKYLNKAKMPKKATYKNS